MSVCWFVYLWLHAQTGENVARAHPQCLFTRYSGMLWCHAKSPKICSHWVLAVWLFLRWVVFTLWSVCSQTKRKSVTCASENENKDVNGAKVTDDGHEEKRSRFEETTSSTGSDSKPAATVTSEKALPPPRCNQCRQLLDDQDLRLFPGDHCDAVSSSVRVADSFVLQNKIDTETAVTRLAEQHRMCINKTVVNWVFSVFHSCLACRRNAVLHKYIVIDWLSSGFKIENDLLTVCV